MSSGVTDDDARATASRARRPGPERRHLAESVEALQVALHGAATAAGVALPEGGAQELSLLVTCAARHVVDGQRASREALVELVSRLLPEAWVGVLAGLDASLEGALEAAAAVDAAADGGLDPFEALLEAVAPRRRRARGVYFTPAVLVDHIVGSVDAVLRQDLAIEAGLADTRSFREAGLLVDGVDPHAPRVRVLDPAAGAGAFLCGVVRRVHASLDAAWRAEGMADAARLAAWRAYVPRGLLPRLVGVELSAAACALARLRLAGALRATGVELSALDTLAIHERSALAAGALEALGPATVIVGNPPYARGSANRGLHLDALLVDYKRGLRGERNLQPLADDYIKFVRVAQHHVEGLPLGLIAMVTNHAFLSGRLHRRMRESLLEGFPRAHVLDLHGSTKAHRGAERDENIFPIAQGVCFTLVARGPGVARRVTHHALRGRRAAKLACIAAGDLPPVVELAPAAPMFLLSPRTGAPPEYEAFVPLPELFEFHGVGGKPGDDGLLVDFDPHRLAAGLAAAREELAGGAPPQTEARRKLARWPAGRPLPGGVVPYAYRPFDMRYVYDAPDVWTRPVRNLRRWLTGEPALLTTRLSKDQRFDHVFASRTLPDVIFLSASSSVNCYVFPSGALRPDRWPAANAPAREDLFDYVYGVLHSRGYRRRYGSALEHDFPRIPAPVTQSLFERLGRLGRRLLALHLGDRVPEGEPAPRFHDGGDRVLRRVAERGRQLGAGERVHINRASFFEPVSARAWAHRVGGYQVLHKWLDDRRRAGRSLSDAEVATYRDVVARVNATVAAMDEVERVIEAAGGWPGAFVHGDATQHAAARESRTV